mmetsp:Transcript_23507/g.41659  ORF Transcript_23507/g.41659 Transcript_23507/m.41659 type:complete len:135 (+) Transcript_23507:200-604(+)
MPPPQTETLAKEVFGKHYNSLLFCYTSGKSEGAKDLQRIWYNFPEFTEKNTACVDSAPKSVVQSLNHIKIPEYRHEQDSQLKILMDYLKFYSYNDYHREVTSLQHFMQRIPFEEYSREHSKPDYSDYGEHRRFG